MEFLSANPLSCLASFIPVVAFVGIVALYNHALPIAVVVMRLESELSLGERALGATYVRMRLGPLYPLLLKAEVQDEQYVKYSAKSMLTDRTLYLLTCTFVLQLSLFVVSWSIYHFSFM